jgi:hypothetical protein
MLVIAIGYGYLTDPFTCSATPGIDNALPEPTGDAVQPYLDFICQAQNLHPQWIDEIIVVEIVAPKLMEVTHHFGSDDGLGDVEEDDDGLGEYLWGDPEDCKRAGDHLTSIDGDGFCNNCGNQ